VREKPNVSRPGCATSHLHPVTTKLVSMATLPGGSKRNNFRFIIYNHSSTNPENLAKILRLFVRAESSIKRNKSKTYSPPCFIFQQPGGLNESPPSRRGSKDRWRLAACARAHRVYRTNGTTADDLPTLIIQNPISRSTTAGRVRFVVLFG